jgi:hypothetical protein
MGAKTLLMISYAFPPNPSAGAVRSERFARYLGEYGWDVEVVTIGARRDLFEDGRRLKTLGDHVHVHFTTTMDPWLRLMHWKTDNFLLRNLRSGLMRLLSFPDHMIFWIPFAVAQGLAIKRKREIGVIYTSGPPHSSHLSGLLLSKLTGIPFVADFRDPWTLNRYHPFHGKRGIEKILLGFERIMEKSVLSGARKVLANTEANRTNLLEAFSWVSEDKVVHLPNGWEEFPSEVYCAEKKEGPLTIVHAGTFYPRFKPYGLLYALAAWRDGQRPPSVPPLKKGDIKIVLLGSRDEETARIISELNINEFVEIRPWVALDEARRIMCQADLLWASLGTGHESSTYIPSKLFEYFAARRPILGFFPEGEAAELIKQTGTGMVFTDDGPSRVICFLAQVCEGRREERESDILGKRRIDILSNYEISAIVKKFAAILDGVIKNCR